MLMGKKIHVARNKNTRLWAVGTLVMIRCKYTLGKVEINVVNVLVGTLVMKRCKYTLAEIEIHTYM